MSTHILLLLMPGKGGMAPIAMVLVPTSKAWFSGPRYFLIPSKKGVVISAIKQD